MENNFAIRYISGNDSDKYVGSISDYQDGGFADPVLMSEDEAQKLYDDLTAYVEAERIGENDEDNEQAHAAFAKGEWGFSIEEMPMPDYDDEEAISFGNFDDEK